MSRSRNWCYTVNNPSEGEIESLKALFSQELVVFHVFQQENAPTTGTPHIQGYVRFTNARTMRGISRLAGFGRAHLEIAKGSPKQNMDYCTKEETRIAGPWTFGTCPTSTQGSRTDLTEFVEASMSGTDRDALLIEQASVFARHFKWADAVVGLHLKKRAKQSYNDFFDSSKPDFNKFVGVLFGEAGTGKTSWILRTFERDDVFKLDIGDGSSNALWFDTYNGESTLLIDDFFGGISFSFLLKLLDVYALRVAVKGSFTYVNFRRVFITSNLEPDEWYANLHSKHPRTWNALKRRIHHAWYFDLSSYGQCRFRDWAKSQPDARPDLALQRLWEQLEYPNAAPFSLMGW